MWFKKHKTPPEQGRMPERQVQRSGVSLGPAFSYYSSNRGVEPQRVRPSARQEQGQAPQKNERKKRPAFSQLPFWLLVALLVVCAAKVLWLSTDPKVIIVGKSAVSANYLQPSTVYADAAHQLLTGSLTSHTKLTVDLNGTAAALERRFPELQAVSLGVPLISSRPIVYVQVAQPSLVLQTAGGNYALNKSGVVLAKLSAIPSGIPLITDQSGARPAPGKQFLPSSTMAFVQTAAYQLTAAHIPVSAYTLPSGSPYELDAHVIGQSYYIKFNLQADVLKQSGAAIATLQHLGSSIPSDYLDVRVPGRAYYK